MGLLDQIYHLTNFLAPALAVGVFLAMFGPFIVKNSVPNHGLIAQAAINCIAGSVALVLGLWFFGRDGKMASYAALVAVTATSQWMGARAWR
jgi:hypothetical protein